MLHTAFVVLHALSGLIAFGLGIAALRQAHRFDPFLAALVAMAVFLAAAVARSWTDLDDGTRVVFAGLGVLAAVMLVRAVAARGRIRPAGQPPHPAFVGHLGFVPISLFNGFVVVAVLDLGAPVWVAVAAAVAGVGLGHVALAPERRRATVHV